MPSPQRQRENSSPQRQLGGYPPAMYGGPGQPFPGGPHLKSDFEGTSSRYSGQPPPGFGPQGFQPIPPPGQYGQFPFYGGFGGTLPVNGYFPPAHPSELGHHPGRFGEPYSHGNTSPVKSSQYSSLSPANNEKSSPPSRKKDTPSSSTNHGRKKEEQHTRARKPIDEENVKDIDALLVETQQEKNSFSQYDDEEEEDFATGVSPMRSDFHFFAAERLNQIEDIKKEKEGEKASPFMLMTALNERLLKSWEDATPTVRGLYLQKEESDRYRFMSEDEIASRHCATLTSRPSSTRKSLANVITKDEEDEEKSGFKRLSIQSKGSENAEASEYESPTKKVKEGENDSEATNGEELEEKIKNDSGIEKYQEREGTQKGNQENEQTPASKTDEDDK